PGGPATQARRALARQEWAAGVAALDEAIRQRPTMARLYQERGHLKLKLGDRGALHGFFEAIRHAPPDLGVNSTVLTDLIQLGKLLHDEKDHDGPVLSHQALLTLTEGRPE